MNSPSAMSFFSRYTSLFRSEEESVYIHNALFVSGFAFSFFKHSKNFNFLSLYLSFRSEEESVYIYHPLFCFAFTFFKHSKFTVNFQYLMNLHCWLFTTESYSYNSNVTTMQHHCFTVPAIFPENKPPIPSENLLTFTNPPHHPLTFTWTSYVYAP